MPTGKIPALLLVTLLTISGCVTLKENTLPATQYSSYDFPAYSVKPPSDPRWRFWYKNKEEQSVSFINSDTNAYFSLWIIPLFKDSSIQGREKNIIEHYQNKTLKEYKLSPDIKLSEQSFQKKEERIGNKAYNILTISYELKNEPYEFSIYYYVPPQNDILYNFSIFKNKKKFRDAASEENLKNDFSTMLKDIKFREPKKEDMITLRVNYAFANFSESAQDKYLKEKLGELKEKYNLALDEVNNWLRLKENNYKAYRLLGVLNSYNDKFERYGEGLDLKEAIANFNTSIQIRKYYKAAHLNLAELYEAIGQADNAINEYQFIIGISPNDENVYYKLGKLYEAKNDKKTAKFYYEKAIRCWGSGFNTLSELKNKIKGWTKS